MIIWGVKPDVMTYTTIMKVRERGQGLGSTFERNGQHQELGVSGGRGGRGGGGGELSPRRLIRPTPVSWCCLASA